MKKSCGRVLDHSLVKAKRHLDCSAGADEIRTEFINSEISGALWLGSILILSLRFYAVSRH